MNSWVLCPNSTRLVRSIVLDRRIGGPLRAPKTIVSFRKQPRRVLRHACHAGGQFRCCLSYALFGRGVGNCFRGLIPQWPMLVTAFAALGMYSLVLVQGRYVAVFLAVAWTGLFAGLRLPATKETRKLAMAASVALLIAVGAPLTLEGAHSLAKGIRHRPHPQWEVAQALRQMGVRPGDRVARVGGTFGADWARLLRARVVAEIPRTSAPEFWTSSSLVQERVIEAFRKTGARIVVAQQIPPLEVFAPTPGWRRIGNTNFYVFQFQPDSKLPE